MRRRTSGRAHGAIAASLRRLRLVAAFVTVAVTARSLLGALALPAVATVAAGLLIAALALAEPRLAGRHGPARTSAVMVAIDTVVLLVVLGLHGVEAGDTAVLLLVLPLLGAGFRHGIFGVLTTWVAIAIAVVGRLAVTWDGAPHQATAALEVVALLLLIGLPAASVSEHLAAAVADQRRPAPPVASIAPVVPVPVAHPSADLAPTPAVVDQATIEATLARAIGGERSELVVAALVGLDDVVPVGEVHGADVADLLVTGVAKRLQRFGGTVGRVGHEELLLVTSVATFTAASTFGDAVRHALRRPVDIGRAGSTTPCAAVGVAVHQPGDGPDAAQLIERATASMFVDRRAQNERFLAVVADQPVGPVGVAA